MPETPEEIRRRILARLERQGISTKPTREDQITERRVRQQERSNIRQQRRMQAAGLEPEPFLKKSLRTGGQVLGGVFDILARPIYGVTGAVEEMMEPGTEKDVGARVLREVFSGIGGLKGDKKFFGEILRERTKGLTKAEQAMLGWSADVLLDPLTYLGPGLFKMIGKGVMAIPGVRAAGQAVKAARPTQALGRAFIPDFELKQMGVMGQQLIKLKEKYTRIMPQQEGLYWSRSIKEAMDGANVRELKEIAQQIDAGIPIQALPDDLRMLATDFKDIFDEVERLDLVAGVLDPDKLRNPYLPGAYPEQGFFARVLGPVRRGKEPFQRRKVYPTLAEREIAGVPTEWNIARLAGLRAAQSIRARSTKEFVDEVLSTAATKINGPLAPHAIPEGMAVYMPEGMLRFFRAKTVPPRLMREAQKGGQQFIEVGLDELGSVLGVRNAEAFLMPREVVNMLNSVNQRFISDKGTNELLGMFDKVMNIWKSHATAVNPGFHFRNMYSNWFLTWIGGVSNPLVYREATLLQMAMREPSLKGAATDGGQAILGRVMKGTNLTGADVINAARETGVYNTGWFGADIPTALSDMLRDASSDRGRRLLQGINPLSRQFGLLRAGRKMGTGIENNARLALFVDQLGKGASIDDAARHVKKFLFDYGDLTDFEKNVMKRLVPFYTWMRKNIPLQIEMLARQPHKYAAVAKAFGEIRATVDENERIPMGSLPAWMQDLSVVQLPMRAVNQAMFLNPNLPFQDLNNLGSIREMASGLSPMLKVPLEQITNRNIFFQRDIEDFPGQLRTTPELELISRIAGHDHPIAVPSRMAHVIANMSPFFRNVSQSVPVGMELARGERPELYNLARFWANLTGVKMIPFSEERARGNQAYAIRDALRQLTQKQREEERMRERFRP